MSKHYSLTLALMFVLLLMSVLLATTVAVADPPPSGGSEVPAGLNSQPLPQAPFQPAPEIGNAPTALEGYICFQSDRDSGDEDIEEIYRMYADGSGQT